MGKIIDLTNKKFGKLTVIKQDGRDNSGKIMWLCRCDCGTEKRIRGNELRQGKTISCGCEGHKRREEGYKKYIEYKKDNPGYNIDLTGQRFGRLTVIGFNQEETKIKRQETSQESSWWDCKCDCGVNVTVMNTSLIHGKTKSCGCLQKEAASRNIKIA